jgi:tRNA (guanine37-N1)-methyltransferase
MQVGIVSLLPEMFAALSDYGISGRAVKQSLVDLHFVNPRDFTEDRHRTVDDKPYGGGPGMLMKTEPLVAAIRSVRQSLATAPGQRIRSIYLSPQGRPLTQELVSELAGEAALILVCGRYQGIDARVIESEIDAEVSLGDFVISGGEMAAMVLLDALIRLQPGALGDEDSALQDSFSEGLLHWPEYTRPANYAGQAVPDVLLSGDHQAIHRWRLKQSLGATWLKRPDLLNEINLNDEQESLLAEFKQEYQALAGE